MISNKNGVIYVCLKDSALKITNTEHRKKEKRKKE